MSDRNAEIDLFFVLYQQVNLSFSIVLETESKDGEKENTYDQNPRCLTLKI